MKDPGRSQQVPPFLQGSDWHSSTSGEWWEKRCQLSIAMGSLEMQCFSCRVQTLPTLLATPKPTSQEQPRS